MKCQVLGCVAPARHEIGQCWICEKHEDRFYGYLAAKKRKQLDPITATIKDILKKNETSKVVKNFNKPYMEKV